MYVAVHAWLLVPHFGEDDAARIAMDAVGWHLTGEVRFDTTEYRMRTSPLYVHVLKRALDVGVPISALPRLMSWASLVLGLVALLSFYVLFRRVTGKNVAAAACVLLAWTPAGWLAATYGMAHGPALAFWALALALLPVGSESVPRYALVRRFLLVTVLAFVALALKADLVLTGLAFPGLVCLERRPNVRFVAAACAVVVVGISVQMAYARSVVTVPPPAARVEPRSAQSATEYAKDWSRRSPFERAAILVPENRRPITNSMGPLWFALALVALACHLASAWGFRLGIWALGWSFPLVVFWGLIFGNSARHNLAALPALALVISSLVFHLAETWRRSVALLGMLFVANYFSDTEGTRTGLGTMVPKTNVLQLSEDLCFRSEKLRDWALEFSRLPDAKKADIERHFLPYGQFAFAAVAQKAGHLTYDGRTFRVTRSGGDTQLAIFQYASAEGVARALSRRLKADGYSVWSHDYGRL